MPIVNNDEGRPRQPSLIDSALVAFSDRGDGFAYVPGEVLVRGLAARGRCGALIGIDPDEAGFEPIAGNDAVEELRQPPESVWYRATGVSDVLDLVDELVGEGFAAQPNHVFFAHSCLPPCGPHPADAFDFVWSGAVANPMRANPMRANPMRANPMRANPMRANPMRANFSQLSTAVPADAPVREDVQLVGPGAHPIVILLDSGIDPNLMAAGMFVAPDAPDAAINLGGGLGVVGPDNYLDPVAGHGTFIAGLIEQRAPGCEIRAFRILDPLGTVNESAVVAAITQARLDRRADIAAGQPRERIINMSFGGTTLHQPEAMGSAVAAAIREGIVIVASAGNDGSCLRQYPAAFRGVIAVGALDSIGPAPFTNYGDWVDACAPGTDLVSNFFNWNGLFPTINTSDIDHFEGWATWSGTSFAAPIVAAAIAREMVLTMPPIPGGSISARKAADRVIRAPHLMRIPCLGTVVNL